MRSGCRQNPNYNKPTQSRTDCAFHRDPRSLRSADHHLQHPGGQSLICCETMAGFPSCAHHRVKDATGDLARCPGGPADVCAGRILSSSRARKRHGARVSTPRRRRLYLRHSECGTANTGLSPRCQAFCLGGGLCVALKSKNQLMPLHTAIFTMSPGWSREIRLGDVWLCSGEVRLPLGTG